MVMKKDLLREFNLSMSQKGEILDYINENIGLLTKVSLRAAIKLAQLVKETPDNWRQMANNGLLDQFA